METPAQNPIVPTPSEGIPVFRLIGLVAAFIIFASLMSFSKDLFNIDLSSYYNWILNYWSPPISVNSNEDETRSGPETVNTSLPGKSSALAPGSAEQFWCFVGEDMTGRWCTQVLSAHMCPIERTYASKNDCEKMPA